MGMGREMWRGRRIRMGERIEDVDGERDGEREGG